jgi:uncharacterized membrane protein HdeD (DUF308 family)
VIEGFLIGVVASTSLIAGLFFLRYWRDTRDTLFLAFAVAFIIEGLNRITRLWAAHPNEGSPWVYVVRCFAFLIILAGIINKNRSSQS